MEDMVNIKFVVRWIRPICPISFRLHPRRKAAGVVPVSFWKMREK